MENVQDELESLKHRLYGSLLLLGVALLAIVLIWSLHPVGTAKLGWALIVWSLPAAFVHGQLVKVWKALASQNRKRRDIRFSIFLLWIWALVGLAGVSLAIGVFPFPLADPDLAKIFLLLTWDAAYFVVTLEVFYLRGVQGR